MWIGWGWGEVENCLFEVAKMEKDGSGVKKETRQERSPVDRVYYREHGVYKWRLGLRAYTEVSQNVKLSQCSFTKLANLMK